MEEFEFPIPKVNFELKQIKEKIEIDPKVFRQCMSKEVEEWSWKRFKYEKWIVHWDKEGKLIKEKISTS